MKPRKPLPPDLARRIPRRFAIETPTHTARIQALREQRILRLFQYHGIDRSDPLASAKLIYHLVPGLQVEQLGKRGPGRPRKTVVRASQNPIGRPRRWSIRDYEFLLHIQQIGDEQLCGRESVRATAFAAVEAGIKIHNEEHQLGMTGTVIRALAVRLTKRLSDARKEVRKVTGK